MSRMLRATFGKRLLGPALALGALLAPAPALAHPTFPGAMQEQFLPAMECPPSCLLCHTRIEGGVDFVKDSPTSFVQNLIYVGQKAEPQIFLNSDNVDQFKKLLVLYGTAPCSEMPGALPCDSDGDGTSDFAELSKNEDPERVGKPLPDCVKYGCGAHIAPTASSSRNVSGSSAGAVCAMLGALVVFGRRARRRSSRG